MFIFIANMGNMWRGSPLLSDLQPWAKVTPSCVFPSLTDDTHIVGPMSELSYAFDHLST
jgi:hypothetical protein